MILPLNIGVSKSQKNCSPQFPPHYSAAGEFEFWITEIDFTDEMLEENIITNDDKSQNDRSPDSVTLKEIRRPWFDHQALYEAVWFKDYPGSYKFIL